MSIKPPPPLTKMALSVLDGMVETVHAPSLHTNLSMMFFVVSDCKSLYSSMAGLQIKPNWIERELLNRTNQTNRISRTPFALGKEKNAHIKIHALCVLATIGCRRPIGSIIIISK